LINVTQIKPNIYVGSYPQNAADVDRLVTGPNITAVLNLQTNDDLRALGIRWSDFLGAYKERSILCMRYPIVDFSPNGLENRLEGAVDMLDQLLGNDHRVYVHCTAGVCRAPAVVIGHLAWNLGMGPKAAIKFVKHLRPCSPYIDSIYLVHVSRTYNVDRSKGSR
jgi:hypothetical protein